MIGNMLSRNERRWLGILSSAIGVLVALGLIWDNVNFLKGAGLILVGLISYHVTCWRQLRALLR